MNAAVTTTPPMEPHWVSRSAFQIVVFLFLFTEISLGSAIYRGASLWIVLPLALIASHLMHGAAVGLHEATHGLLRRNRRLNEFDGVLLGLLGFMSFSLYRAAHQSHHAYLATSRDDELWPFVHPSTPRWGRVLAAFLELTLGIIYTPFLFLRTFLRKGSTIRSRKVRRRIWMELVLMAVVWATVLVAVSHYRVWHYFLWMFLLPAFVAGNLQSWRKYIEHVGLTGSTANGSTRSIIAQGWIGKLIAFTLLHEPYHGVHHMRMGLSHAELPHYASDLIPQHPGERPPYRSYGHALAEVFRCLADPRVGAQWNDNTPAPKSVPR